MILPRKIVIFGVRFGTQSVQKRLKVNKKNSDSLKKNKLLWQPKYSQN